MTTNITSVHNTPASAPELTVADAKELLLKIRTGTQLAIASNHVAILKAINELEDIHAKPDYELSVIKILEEFGPSSLAFIQQVLPDTPQLAKARKALVESGRILETVDGTRKMLSLAEQAVAA